MPNRPEFYAPLLCVGCDQVFTPTHGRQRYCGRLCRASTYKPRRGALATCPQCGVRFQLSHGNRRFCSVECSDAFHKPPRRVLKPCEWCSVETLNQRFCSMECSRQQNHGRVCSECGGRFVRRGRGQRCDDCVAASLAASAEGVAARAQARREGRALVTVEYPRLGFGWCAVAVSNAPIPRTFVAGSCPMCGESFVARAHTGSRYCSSACGKRADREVCRQRRRNRKKGGERIFRRMVFERDNWTCRLCRKPVDRDAVVPAPNAATVDHILPLALGGQHVYANVQCAHFICNSTKAHHVTQLSFAA